MYDTIIYVLIGLNMGLLILSKGNVTGTKIAVCILIGLDICLLITAAILYLSSKNV
jgi:hypothetical protein